MKVAHLSSLFSDFSIDEENSIIRGVRVMEAGKLASFKSSDGTKKTITLDSRHIQALLRQAGNRAISVHWTHAHSEKGEDGLATKVGKLSRFIVGDDGHLRADLHLAPGAFRDSVIWHAKEDRENMMLSPVFSYDPNDDDCIPMDFQAADLVECGAGVTAFCADAAQMDAAAAPPINYTMLSPEDLESIAKLIDSKIVAALAAQTPEPEPAPEPAPPEEDTSAIEEEAGVTDEDKDPEDEKKPANFRAFLRMARAHKRLLNAALAKFDGAKKEIEISAEAKATATLGSLSLPTSSLQKEAKLAAFGTVNGSLPRAAFAALSPFKKSEFCKLGGSISDN